MTSRTDTKSSGKKTPGLTPLMRQFYTFKTQHPDKILFFRMGDFYEMFGDDAVKAAPILGITLTSRSGDTGDRIPLAGVPHHSAEKYLARLLEAGEKVVIVEQVEDPKTAKGIVKRDVVEILTPGTATVETADGHAPPLCLVAVFENDKGQMGLAALDLSTGAFHVDEGDAEVIAERVRVLDPSEIIYPADRGRDEVVNRLGLNNGAASVYDFGEWNFDLRTAERDLNDQFGTSTLDGFGVGNCRLAITAAGAVFRYLRENHRQQLSHITKLSRFADTEYMTLDYTTVRNLELIKNVATSTEQHSLFAVINKCHTAAGERQLRQALLRPFKTKVKIDMRLSGVAELVRHRDLATNIRELTRMLPDLERLTGRLGINKLNPRQAAAIATALQTSAEVRKAMKSVGSPALRHIHESLPERIDIVKRVQEALVEEPPLASNKGDIIRRGFSDRLDALNDSIRDARTYIASLQNKERQRTGIPSLKVGFNKVFGYYIEITKTHSASAPGDYIRKQTLVNAERYITPELKEKEELIMAAEEKIFRCEEELYAELVAFLNENIHDLLLTANLLAELDLIAGLAELAATKGYCRPELYDDDRLVIAGGRHPVIEAVLPAGSFVANESIFDESTGRIHILTGPNMSGKSTYLRQVGLIVLLAQIGSFVPADKAQIGIVDRVFTRVGALDNLARGQSTFLVEMVETANILHNATDRSLVLLDEVGRGTSTFDGLSVAWAVVEHIAEKKSARTIFATHYHELTGMADVFSSVKNFQVAVKKWEDRVVFLHQIVPGGCDDSYGIEVARLAGLPRAVISRARNVLRLLESGKFTRSEIGKGIYKEKVQPTLFEQPQSEVEKHLREIDLDNMTPLQALQLLKELKDELK